jgi:hypothetical protein
MVILRSLDLSQDHQRLIDSFPIPALQFHLAPSSIGDWKAFTATIGKAITKKWFFVAAACIY